MQLFEIPPPQIACREAYSFLCGLLPILDRSPYIFNVNNISGKTLVVSVLQTILQGGFR